MPIITKELSSKAFFAFEGGHCPWWCNGYFFKHSIDQLPKQFWKDDDSDAEHTFCKRCGLIGRGAMEL